ncbi:metallophosphoesterase family protein [Cohnella sp. JJ-181]|uniref:metallophosphoesterase family protein n=1 Tax=Cohnella rhizoplanae TaxID=2974897 RepID=UPI0022FF73F4|nr:metallophosphoesterase [Cohnella sp. JJ-181]CAI6086219.1 3',5'-cyclic adenosine monophosphate phosphodiesterase CpdA [Cohnella sp. JJ-181]
MTIRQDGARPLLTFQVITDTHVTADPEHLYNRNFEQALRDIAANAPDSVGIMHAGDVTDHGYPEEYEELRRIGELYKDKLPPLYMATGNHDVRLGVWETRLGNFLAATGMSSAYHDHLLDGYPFLFLGTEQGLELFCHLSEEQLGWLDAKLGEAALSGKPAFVFLHQPLKNTTAGSMDDQKWYGVTQDDELKAILAKYPRTFLFTGHGHWEMEAERNGVYGEGKLPAMFNAASVAYLWTDADERKEGSQGYYVEVYEDRVVVKGRDFTAGAWVASAQYEVSL